MISHIGVNGVKLQLIHHSQRKPIPHVLNNLLTKQATSINTTLASLCTISLHNLTFSLLRQFCINFLSPGYHCKMTTIIKSLILLLPLLFYSFSTETEARPFNIMLPRNSPTDVNDGLFDGLALGAIKQAGPSPGEGHKLIDSHTLGGIKDSGPSPGAGHKFVDSQTLGGIKESGPSGPGEGHKLVDKRILEGNKQSGPSPGEGH